MKKNIPLLTIFCLFLAVSCNMKRQTVKKAIVDTLIVVHQGQPVDSINPFYLEKVDSSEFSKLSSVFPTSKDTSAIDTARVKWRNDTLYVFAAHYSYHMHPNSKIATFKYITFYTGIQCWLIESKNSSGAIHYSLIAKERLFQETYLVCYSKPLVSSQNNYIFSSGPGYKAEDLRIYKNEKNMLSLFMKTDLMDWSVLEAKWYSDNILWLKRKIPKKNDLNSNDYDVDYVQMNLSNRVKRKVEKSK